MTWLMMGLDAAMRASSSQACNPKLWGIRMVVIMGTLMHDGFQQMVSCGRRSEGGKQC